SERCHREMVSRTVLLTLAGDRRLEVDAAAPILDGAVDGLERRANVADPLRCEPRGAAIVVSQVVLGQNLHRLVRGTVEVAYATAASSEQTVAAADAGAGGPALAAGGVGGVRGGWLKGGTPTDRGQPTRLEVCGKEEDGPAVVSDDAVAHGHGLALGFSHRP